jgi:hypothetical protein
LCPVLGEPNDSGPALSCIQSTRLRAGVNAFPICSISVNLHTFSKNIFREHVDGSQMVAGYAGCITHAVNTGFSYFGMSAFFPSFEREFGWSRTAISGAFSLARVESGILGPIEGYLTRSPTAAGCVAGADSRRLLWDQGLCYDPGSEPQYHDGRHLHGPDHRRIFLRSHQKLHNRFRYICRSQPRLGVLHVPGEATGEGNIRMIGVL